MHKQDLLEATKTFVKNELKTAEAGHDWFHIQRVCNLAVHIAKAEAYENLHLIKIAALLHDIADAKFYNGDESIGPKKAGWFLEQYEVKPEFITEVQQIIRHVSFKTEAGTYHSKALEIIQDADRLDALGAIGIARTFNYGGYKHRSLFDPTIPPQPDQSKAEYKASKAPTLNHFYEKLLLLKDQMYTTTAQKIAQSRHDYMVEFIQLYFGLIY